MVHPVDVQDRDSAKLVLTKARDRDPDLQPIWAYGGYRGKMIERTEDKCDWTLQIVKRSDDIQSSEVLPGRWVVTNEAKPGDVN